MKHLVAVGLTVAAAVALMAILINGATLADAAKKIEDVFVTNGPSNPVPVSVQGSAIVQGTVGISPSANTVVIGNSPSVSILGTPTVKISGDDASRLPVQFTFRGTLLGGNCSLVYTVPSGMRFVTEYVAATLTTFAGQLPTLSMQIFTTVAGTQVPGPNIWLPATKLGPFVTTGFDQYQVGQQLRAYADAGNTVRVCSSTPFSGVSGSTMAGDILIAGYQVSR